MKHWPFRAAGLRWPLALLPLLSLAACGGSGEQPGALVGTSSPVPVASTSPSPMSTATPDGQREPDEFLAVADPRIDEASGLARSFVHPGVIYLHNDKESNEVFAVDASGTRAVLRLDRPTVDFEDIASTPDGRVWVGDIGDNDATRSEIAVDVFTEPDVLTSTTLRATTYRFRYPDGAHNAEALLVNPSTHQIYIVSKQESGAKVYAAPAQLTPTGVNMLKPVQAAPTTVTAGDFRADGVGFVLRNYGRAFYYTGFGAQPVVQVLPHQPQGEGITFDRDGTHVLLASEGAGSPILRVPVPSGAATD